MKLVAKPYKTNKTQRIPWNHIKTMENDKTYQNHQEITKTIKIKQNTSQFSKTSLIIKYQNKTLSVTSPWHLRDISVTSPWQLRDNSVTTPGYISHLFLWSPVFFAINMFWWFLKYVLLFVLFLWFRGLLVLQACFWSSSMPSDVFHWFCYVCLCSYHFVMTYVFLACVCLFACVFVCLSRFNRLKGLRA